MCNMRFHIIFQVLTIPALFTFVIGENYEPTGNNLLQDINSLIQEVMEVYMNSFNCIAWAEEKGASLRPSPHFSNLLIFIDEDNIDNLLLQIFSYKCQGWILQLSDPLSFLTKWEGARRASMVRFNPRILILPWNESSYTSTLFQSPEFDYIADVVAAQITDSSEGLQLQLLTNNFFLNIKNDSSEIYLGIWPNRDEIGVLYSNKIDDLQGKELRIATLQYLPYSQLSPDFDGVEIRIFQAFCKSFNCHLTPVTDDDQWGEIFDNGTGNGIVGNVYHDKADVGVGAVYLWYYEHIEYAYPYIPSRVTVLLPKPSPMPEWRVPFAPFDLALWIGLILSIMTVSFVLFYMNKYLLKFSDTYVSPSEFKNWSGVILRSLGMAVGQSPQTAFSSGSTIRIVFTTFEILFLLYGTIYGSSLSSVLTVPEYYPPIDNMQELYASSLPWAADHIAWVKSLRDADEPMIKGLLEKFEVHDQDTLLQLTKKGGYGFTIELTNGGHVSEASFLSADMINNLHVMKEPLYYTYSTTIARKGSPYIEQINKIVLKCIDSGLLQLWESEMMSKYGSSIIQMAFKLSRTSRQSNEIHELVKLKLRHTQGAFILLGFGVVTGAIVFMFECYYTRMKRPPKQIQAPLGGLHQPRQ